MPRGDKSDDSVHDLQEWMPNDKQSQFGERGFSFVRGQCLVLTSKNEFDIVKSLQNLGDIVEKNESLVLKACGVASRAVTALFLSMI